MTKLEAQAELKRIKLTASGDTKAPGFADAASAVLATFHAPGAWGKQLSDSEKDARQEAREAALLEAALNGE